MSRAGMWIKMAATLVVFSVGGPALIYYVQPTDEELFKKYNPELQKRSLENREQRQQDFDNFVNKLKGYSKSDKPSNWTVLILRPSADKIAVWEVAAADEAHTKANALEEQKRQAAEIEKRRDEIKRLSMSGK
ncbi:MAG: hypothetical protein Q9170_001642 [Blastenia crenularia]